MAEDSIFIYNNLLVSETYNTLRLYSHYGGAVVRNNTIVRRGVNRFPNFNEYSSIFGVGGPSGMLIENNAFWCLNVGIQFQESEIVPGGGEFTVAYNDFWRADSGPINVVSFEGNLAIDTSHNIFRKPMFVDDSLYYLQRGSPLIDAGNPELIDLDLTRSDIGWTGGIWGVPYVSYPELPPDAPDTLMSTIDGDSLYLIWPMNQEADLEGYRVYRGLESGFSLIEGNVIAELAGEDTTFVYPIPDSSIDMFFTITALDTAGLESPPSNEIAAISTGVFDDEQLTDQLLHTPQIIGNYPNPFNTSTTIEYIVPDIGAQTHVQLTIYDILGRKVATLVNETQMPGKYRATWNGTSDAGHSAASGMYFARLHIQGFELSPSRKLILQK